MIERYIPYGRENAVTRTQLMIRTGLPDRKVRREIEKARSEGNIIINAQTGEGYYRTDDLNEIERQYRQEKGRALSILRQLKPLRRALKSAGRKV